MARTPGARVDLASVQTNIVNIDLEVRADAVATRARDLGVLIHASGPSRLRAVTHLDVSSSDVRAAAVVLARAIAEAPRA
jgi:threonine aldolase